MKILQKIRNWFTPIPQPAPAPEVMRGTAVATAPMVTSIYEIYDLEFQRQTGFGLFPTASEAQAFLDGLENRTLTRGYVVRAKV